MPTRLASRLRQLLSRQAGGRLQALLTVSFALVAALTVGIHALATSRVIADYLTAAEADRVARDMTLAQAFYQLKLDEVAAISHRLVLDRWVIENAGGAARNDPRAVGLVDGQITNKITVLALGGTHLIALLDRRGELLVARVLDADGGLSPLLRGGAWGDLPIVASALANRQEQRGTEVIPAEYLATVGLAGQARVDLLETARAAPQPFDAREGSAGLALMGVAPVQDEAGQVIGAVLSAYLFNNDFTLVDRIREVAGVDTVTIFFGDLRVSTNVQTQAGERAVGTRISQEVYDVVLEEGRDYVGRAFVVNDIFITRYAPLRNHLDQVVGSLYVGARESSFRALVEAFTSRVAVIGALAIALAAVVAAPIARWIAAPIARLVEATERLAGGDMAVRVEVGGEGELARLADSFNRMVATLERTQTELLHKEKLASMGQLAAGVAHEINNPLGTIYLFGGALRKELAAGDARRDDLDTILRETDRCKRIVGDLLNFARQQEVLAHETDLHQLLDQAVASMLPHPAFAGVTIERFFDPQLPLLEADPSQLLQVFVNLLANAAEAIDGAGTITLTTRHADGSVEVDVHDTGCGISPENLRKLFTPFFTTKPSGRGTGLGLSIVYGIIKMHRGQISVRSQPGQGTTFTIVLPLRQAREGLG